MKKKRGEENRGVRKNGRDEKSVKGEGKYISISLPNKINNESIIIRK